MKKILLVVLMAYSSTMFAAAPTEKVLSSFNKSFPEAKNVSWSEDESSYVVYFSKGMEQCRLWYSKDGDILKSIRYYTKELLNPFIQSRIEAKYAGLSIHDIVEVNSEEGIEYFITLEDDKKWYRVKSDATGQLHLEKKLVKG